MDGFPFERCRERLGIALFRRHVAIGLARDVGVHFLAHLAFHRLVLGDPLGFVGRELLILFHIHSNGPALSRTGPPHEAGVQATGQRKG